MPPVRKKRINNKNDCRVKVVGRKERRRREREAKKQRKAVFNSRFSTRQPPAENEVSSIPVSTTAPKVSTTAPKVSTTAPKVSTTAPKVAKKHAVKRISAAAEKDLKEIIRLEKLLNIKNNRVPQSFASDGLDYVLGAVGSYDNQSPASLEDELGEEWEVDDSERREKNEGGREMEDGEIEDEGEEMEADVEMDDEKELEDERDGYNYNSDSDEDYEIDEEELMIMEQNRMKFKRCVTTYLPTPEYGTTYGILKGGIIRSSEKKNSTCSRVKKEVSFHLLTDGEDTEEVAATKLGNGTALGRDWAGSFGFKEGHGDDVSGGDVRTMDAEGGGRENVSEDRTVGQGKMSVEAQQPVSQPVVVASIAKYTPPQVANRSSSQRLVRKVQGLMNRLSESNMRAISSDIEALYREASRNDMNSAVWHVLERLSSGPVAMSNKFAMEQAMLVAILHHHVGCEVGSSLTQCLVVALNKELDTAELASSTPGRTAQSLLLLLTHLYNYKVVHCVLVYDIIRKLLASFTERNIELLLLLLKNAGMEIRKDDPGSLKAVILQIQSAAASSDLSTTPRVKFMLETLSALKTNNARKIPNYDPSVLEHMKKLLRSIVRTSGSLDEAQVKVSLEDLLNADKRGRWWVVGSAWTGRAHEGGTAGRSIAGKELGKGSEEAWILDMAKKQRMNTDLRKTLFGVIMTSEDYVDCFQKLVKLKLSNVQEREIVHVLLDCCLQEKLYNPYYAHLAQKLCEFKKSYQVTFQYSVWDRFKVLDSQTSFGLANLRQLLYHLITKKALSLAILKVVEFTELNDSEIGFYKNLFHSLLVKPSESVVTQVFSRIAPYPNLKKLRDNLMFFLDQYLKASEDSSLLEDRIKLVEKSLASQSQLF